MKRSTRVIVPVFLCLCLLQVFVHVFGQDKKKKAVPVPTKTNVAVEAPTDTLIDSMGDKQFIVDTSTTTRFLLLPEFYSYWPVTKADTIIKYQCYDPDNGYINVDTLTNINDIKHIHLVKIFTNYLHTYIDGEGKPRSSTASKVIFKYDRTDNNAWKSYDYRSGWLSELIEDKSEIVKQDTTTFINSVTGSKRLTIRKYYKVTEIKHKGEIDTENDK